MFLSGEHAKKAPEDKSVLTKHSVKIGGQEVLSLYDDKRGSLPIPRDWTDQAVLSPDAGLIEPAPILDARCLLKLHDLVQAVTKRIDDE